MAAAGKPERLGVEQGAHRVDLPDFLAGQRLYEKTEAGHGLEIVGLVIGAHTLGMFGLAPVSGRLADRLGAPLVIGVGCAVLAFAGLLAAATPAVSGAPLAVPLFLLGVGWSLTFVAGSRLLASSGPLADRIDLMRDMLSRGGKPEAAEAAKTGVGL